MNAPIETRDNRVDIVFGAAYGDEGKGIVTAELAKRNKSTLTVRYNGGATAGHSVYRRRNNGRVESHVFQQFGSGTFEGCLTYLSKFFRFKPYDFVGEVSELQALGFSQGVTKRVSLDERSIITTPYHTAHSQHMGPIHNRGTCGVGSGESWRYSLTHPEATIYGKDLLNEMVMREKLRVQASDYYATSRQSSTCIRPHAVEEIADLFAWVGSMINIVGEDDWLKMRSAHKSIIMEGSQGYWISITSPFAPYVTSSDTSPFQARKMLEDYNGIVKTTACINMYTSRHGQGPLPTEDPRLFDIFKDYAHEGEWNGVSRYGWFDTYLTARCLEEVGNVDYMAISHLDCFDKLPGWRIALNKRNKKYEPVYRHFKKLKSYLRCISEEVGHSIDIKGYNQFEREFVNYP